MNRVGLVLSVCCLSFSPAAIADNLHPEQTPRKAGDTVVDRTGKPMVLIPAGQFTMGDKHDHDRDARGAHKVRITRAFYMDKYEVTRGDFAACVKAGVCFWPLGERTRPITPTGSTQRENWGLKYCGPKMFRAPADHPLTCVDYNEARYYCEAWRGGRLPTEAEWEYAGRGGLEGKQFPWGSEQPTSKLAHFGQYHGTGAVGRYPANGYGLFDMAGSVWEWTNDWYDANYYAHSPVEDPKGECDDAPKCPGHPHRTMRSGSWITGSLGMRVTYRNHHKTWNRFEVVGVRWAKDL